MSEVTQCPTCSGPVWDNRPKKASGEFKSNSPDFSCKDKACGWKQWPEKKGAAPHKSAEGPGKPRSAPPSDADERLVGIMADCINTVLENTKGRLEDGACASIINTLFIGRSKLITNG